MLGGAIAEGFGILMMVPLATIAMGEGRGGSSRFGWLFVDSCPTALCSCWPRSSPRWRSLPPVLRPRRQLADSRRAMKRACGCARRRPLRSAAGRSPAGSARRACNRCCSTTFRAPAWRSGWPASRRRGGDARWCNSLLAALLSPALSLLALAICRRRRCWRSAGSAAACAAAWRWSTAARPAPAPASGFTPASRRPSRKGRSRNSSPSTGPALSRREELARFARHRDGAGAGVHASAVAAAFLLFVGYRLLALPFPSWSPASSCSRAWPRPPQQLQHGAARRGLCASFAAIESRLEGLEPVAPATPRRSPGAVVGTARGWGRLPARRGTRSRPRNFRALTHGQWLGVSGASGGGKTTLLDIVAGLLAPQHGQVRSMASPLTGARPRALAGSFGLCRAGRLGVRRQRARQPSRRRSGGR